MNVCVNDACIYLFIVIGNIKSYLATPPWACRCPRVPKEPRTLKAKQKRRDFSIMRQARQQVGCQHGHARTQPGLSGALKPPQCPAHKGTDTPRKSGIIARKQLESAAQRYLWPHRPPQWPLPDPRFLG